MMTDKRKKLLDTALQLFVEKGYHSVSTASIAKQAGVATGTLFHHFPTKDALLKELLITVKQEFSNTVLDTTSSTSTHSWGTNNDVLSPKAAIRQQAKSIWYRGLDWAVDNPEKLQLFLAFSQIQLVREIIGEPQTNSLLHFLYELVQKGVDLSLFKPYSQEMLAEWCHSQFLSTASYIIDQPTSMRDEIKLATFSLLWDGMCKH